MVIIILISLSPQPLNFYAIAQRPMGISSNLPPSQRQYCPGNCAMELYLRHGGGDGYPVAKRWDVETQGGLRICLVD